MAASMVNLPNLMSHTIIAAPPHAFGELLYSFSLALYPRDLLSSKRPISTTSVVRNKAASEPAGVWEEVFTSSETEPPLHTLRQNTTCLLTPQFIMRPYHMLVLH